MSELEEFPQEPFCLDMPYLILAFEDDSEETTYYSDKQTGNVLLVRSDLLDRDDLTDEIEKNRERYLYIPKLDHKQLKEDINDFIQDISDNHLKNLLTVAQESPNVLFALKKILASYPNELERLEKFRDGRICVRVHQWLGANFIAHDFPEANSPNS